ncbi:hypothetical protein [Rhizobium laguerreae]|uniref:hypothetical protein n=1 Tax=Rhizobium laguerreae TaxID=1076926 RepID=UPI001441C431|nr:hypothetical protein [Rhizobium laguerreae]NKM33947.1 hypothetical protein [Rhizobium laguerreae]
MSTDAHHFLLKAANRHDAACCELQEGDILVQLRAFEGKSAGHTIPADLEGILDRAQERRHSHVRFAPPPTQTEIDLAFDYFYRSGARRYTQRGSHPNDLACFPAQSLPLGRSAGEYCEMLQVAVANFDPSPVNMRANQHQISELWRLSRVITDAKACTPGEWWLCDEIIRIFIRLLDYFITQIGADWSEQLESFERTVFGARSALASSLRAPIATKISLQSAS